MKLNGQVVMWVGLAVVGALMLKRKPPAGAPVLAAQPGQQQRDTGLAAWLGVLGTQQRDITDKAAADYADELARIGVM